MASFYGFFCSWLNFERTLAKKITAFCRWRTLKNILSIWSNLVSALNLIKIMTTQLIPFPYCYASMLTIFFFYFVDISNPLNSIHNLIFRTVWPDEAKFCHFGKMLKTFWGVYLIFSTILIQLWQNFIITYNLHCCKWPIIKQII